MAIEITNIQLLDEKEREIANRLFNEYHSKIERMIKNPLLLKISIKNYKKAGEKVKYSLNAEAVFAGEKVISSSAWDWDLTRTIHKLMIKIENEIEHKFHIEDLTRKSRK